MKYLLLVIVTITLFSFKNQIIGQTADLKVVVTNIDDLKGDIMIGVFDNALDFKSKKNPIAGADIKIKDTKVTYVFSKLTCTRIAVAVFHDKNNNGELDTKKLGIPVEGVGFSSKVASKLHQPVFPEASFLFKNDTTIFINMYYTKQE